MTSRLDNIGLGHQLALVAAGLCLLVGATLVSLAAVSGQHVQSVQQAELGSALAKQLARRIATTLETGNLLSVAASMQRFVESSPALEATLFDVEGKAIGQAGAAAGRFTSRYEAQVRVEDDIAGRVVLVLGNENARSMHQRLILSLAGLALLLSAAVYGATHYLGQRLSRRLERLEESLSLEDAQPEASSNSLVRLEQSVAALPMDLLRTRSSAGASEENYRTTAVIYLHLTSLIDYVDTLDQASLLRYTRRLHQVVYGAAGFYGGELQVIRQFGLALFFSGEGSAGSAAYRAAASAWLIKSVAGELEKQMPLSLGMAMAIDQSELGAGDESDIYPGLYIQHTLDELHGLCASKPPKILLSPAVCEDSDVLARLVQHPSELRDYGMLEEFAEPHNDLLERQLRLLLRRLAPA